MLQKRKAFLNIISTSIKNSDGTTSKMEIIRNITDQKKAQQKLQDNEYKYRELFENMSSGVVIYEAVDDGDNFIISSFNCAAEKIEGLKREDVIGKKITEIFPAVVEFGLFDVLKKVFQTGSPKHFPLSFYNDERLAEWRDNYVYRLPTGEVIAIYDDVTEKKQAEFALASQHKYLQSIIDGVDDPIMVIKEDYTVELMNNSTKESLNNLNISDPENPKCYEISHHRSTPCDGFEHPCPLRDVLESKQHTTVIHNHVTKDGDNRYIELSAGPLYDEDKNCIGIIESARDITGHLEIQDELRDQKSILDHQVHHDALTGLANRILFNDRLNHAIKEAKQKKTKVALLFIDLDHFKEINDSLGHNVGDVVLKAVTSRLKEVIRDEDSIARLGGDEFTIILEDLTQAQDASLIANKLLDSLSKTIQIDDNELYVSSSIGISIYPDDGVDTQSLLKFADSAMYKAKDEGRNNFQFYNSKMTEIALERVVMEASLRAGLKNEEFIVYYQPQINGVTYKLIGMEALVRWQHPTMGLVSPAKFIPLAESTGLIVELDRYVMKTAMTQLSQWYRDGLNPGVLAMNLAVKQLKQSDFIEVLQNLIKETNTKPEWLELEVTEGQIMTNPEEAIKILKSISDLGVELAVDDFGTGYSSLAYLKRLPIDKLKIDQEFVRDLPGDEEDVGITKAVIALANSLNLRVIAEGVETKEQRDFIVENGCENIQGYFYSKPVSADEFEVILRDGFTL